MVVGGLYHYIEKEKNFNKRAKTPKKAKKKYCIRKSFKYKFSSSKKVNNIRTKTVREFKEKNYARKPLIYKLLHAKTSRH